MKGLVIRTFGITMGRVLPLCMHIGYVPQKRPPFSALNFRSGAYNFHTFPKNPFRIISISPFFFGGGGGGFCRSGDHHFKNFFNFNPFIASHGRLSPNAAPWVSQTRPGSSVESHFQRSADQARSRAPHLQAQNGSISVRRPSFSRSTGSSFLSPCQMFTLPRYMYTYQNFGDNEPPE